MEEKLTVVQWLEEKLIGHLDISERYKKELFEQAKEMEFQQRKKDFVNGYKARAKESNLIFDETSEMYAIKLFNETFKSE